MHLKLQEWLQSDRNIYFKFRSRKQSIMLIVIVVVLFYSVIKVFEEEKVYLEPDQSKLKEVFPGLCSHMVRENVEDPADKLLKSGEKYYKRLHLFYVHQLDTDEPMNVENFRFFLHFGYVPCSSTIFFTFLLTHNSIDKRDSFSKGSEDFNANIKTNMKELNLTNHLINLLGSERASKMLKCLHTGEVVNSKFGKANTKIMLVQNRPGGDLCAFTLALRTNFWLLNEALFRYIFFINSSVRGPFLPVYYYKPWWEMFTDMFRYYPNDTVAVGPYLSGGPKPHVQSFLICVDQRGLQVLREVFRCKKNSHESSAIWVPDTEVRLGPELLKRNYSIRGFLSIYGGLGNQKEINEAELDITNPTTTYPLTPRHRNAFKTVDGAKGQFVVNVFETAWIKFNRKFPMSQYTKLYVPMYTSFMYQNLKKQYYGRARETFIFEDQD